MTPPRGGVIGWYRATLTSPIRMTDVHKLIVTKVENILGSFCVLNRAENTVNAVQDLAEIVVAELGFREFR
jgi:hypothetical protein